MTFTLRARPTAMRASIVLLLYPVSLLSVAAAPVESQDRWGKIAPGAYDVGFRIQRTVDPTRNINSHSRGTPLGLAIWYPAQKSAAHPRPITQSDYRLLAFSQNLDSASKEAFLQNEADMMVSWRHVGIVPLTPGQARASLDTHGRAVLDARPAQGKFPVVIVLGGPFYLSTTAEILASNGHLVVAPVRYSDQSNEVPPPSFMGYVEDGVRDAEWALSEVSRDAAADTTRVAALGHGGGGMEALLLAMRNRGIHSVANIDAAIFSTRSNPRQLAFYDPRLLRIPYLYIVTAGTKRESDQYRDFDAMRFSKRYEVVLENPAIRHHDLSDIGRAVSAPLGIRGDAQGAVEQCYADVQRTLVEFLDSHASGLPKWIEHLSRSGGYSVAQTGSVEPAPTTDELLQSVDARLPERLKQAHDRDPEAPLFSEDEIQRLVSAARTKNQPAIAAQLARFAITLHGKSVPVLQLASATFEFAGNHAEAREIATQCVALELPSNDWRASSAQAKCRELLR